MKRYLSPLPYLLGSGLLLVAAVAQAGGLGQNTILVTTTADGIDHFDGFCSLREAIQNANLNVQGSPIAGECVSGSGSATDEIVLVSGETYELTEVGASNDEGDLDLFQNVPITLDLRFETDGEAPATIEQTVVGERVLHNLGLTVQIDNITLRGGSVAGDVGGGILNESGVMALSAVTVLSNSAISGAGIYNDGVMSLSNSQVILNTASLIGGGILNDTDAQLSLMSTQVRGNTATAGGGIYNTGGQVSVIEGSSINLNTASSGNGGGIENTSNGSMTIANASFEGNRAMGGDGSGRGGAIRHDSFQSFVITDSNFSGNEAVFGGALQVGNDTPLQVSGSTFDDNSASFNGGALHAVFLSVQNSSFEANHASVSGGAILAQAVAGISDSSFINNDALAGGAIQVLNLELTNVELRENGSSGGGAVSVSDAATIDRSRFIDNSGGLGGGLYVHDTGGTGNLTSITRSLFTGNTATDGGGVYIRSNASIGNTTIHNNFANNAGGLYIHADGDVTAVNMTLAGHITGQDLHKLGKLTMGNSIIFTPGQPDCLSTLDDPPIYSLGNNVTDDDSCFFDQDLPSDQEIANPMLDALADNGGGSMTLALLDGSALIDAGSNDLCAAAPVNGVDQRGAVRPQGATCDIGAHEQGSVAPSIDEIFKDGFEQN